MSNQISASLLPPCYRKKLRISPIRSSSHLHTRLCIQYLTLRSQLQTEPLPRMSQAKVNSNHCTSQSRQGKERCPNLQATNLAPPSQPPAKVPKPTMKRWGEGDTGIKMMGDIFVFEVNTVYCQLLGPLGLRPRASNGARRLTIDCIARKSEDVRVILHFGVSRK